MNYKTCRGLEKCSLVKKKKATIWNTDTFSVKGGNAVEPASKSIEI